MCCPFFCYCMTPASSHVSQANSHAQHVTIVKHAGRDAKTTPPPNISLAVCYCHPWKMIRQRRPAPAQSPSSAAAATAEEPTLSTPAPRTAKERPAAKMDFSGESRRVPSSPPADERRSLLPNTIDEGEDESFEDHDKMGWARQNKWIVLAIASGACAAFNGVFAKLYVGLVPCRRSPFFIITFGLTKY